MGTADVIFRTGTSHLFPILTWCIMYFLSNLYLDCEVSGKQNGGLCGRCISGDSCLHNEVQAMFEAAGHYY